ncbi:MAG: glycosyltransferase family 2 protein [Planctomycetaceae bacterium]
MTDRAQSPVVTLVTVLYQPDWNRTGPIIEQALRALDACNLAGELVVMDNSPSPTVEALALCPARPGCRYVWNQGYNIYIAGALSAAVRLAHAPKMLYFCASHGLQNDPTWLTDLIEPLVDQKVGLAGHVQPCEFNRVAAVPEDIIEPQIHVQGGLWAARREVLQEFGFGHRFPFEFCDVDLSRRLVAADYRLASVPTVASVAGGVIPDPEHYKYVHDYR